MPCRSRTRWSPEVGGGAARSVDSTEPSIARRRASRGCLRPRGITHSCSIEHMFVTERCMTAGRRRGKNVYAPDGPAEPRGERVDESSRLTSRPSSSRTPTPPRVGARRRAGSPPHAAARAIPSRAGGAPLPAAPARCRPASGRGLEQLVGRGPRETIGAAAPSRASRRRSAGSARGWCAPQHRSPVATASWIREHDSRTRPPKTGSVDRHTTE